MRAVVLLLVLANLGLWAYMDYVAPQQRGATLAQQVQPERLKLIAGIDGAEVVAAASQACIEFGPLDESALARAKDTARTLQANISMAERRTETAIFLELREPSEIVVKQLGDSLKGASSGPCALES
ncbi:MAG TPA: hypothetical protein VJM53_01125 [Burkholderiales bacterium]|nr:hypothetical protein [Burkholderiales bacterium]